MNDLMLEYDEDAAGLTRRCPMCPSTHIEEPDVARRFGGAIGGIARTTSGLASALTRAEIG